MMKGHKVSLADKATKFAHVQASLEQLALARPEWIGFDESAKDSTFVSLPTRDSVPYPVEIGQNIEFYSK